eukprot:CAMPEP_0181301988 /NCGR_PEP_ID=MMETSP1101-20121128/7723_1 /TAXON_ID=46948 /ORGANISM="Rhodomonas abbreviata, Strain Caron Lab Isolate" /LENGTH=72 /DNA_ID=CAMNT_0023407341 /DNA_START=220 /DNA_END=438 /DNA_ORIENTATION=+
MTKLGQNEYSRSYDSNEVECNRRQQTRIGRTQGVGLVVAAGLDIFRDRLESKTDLSVPLKNQGQHSVPGASE